jgi:hypothetical protein
MTTVPAAGPLLAQIEALPSPSWAGYWLPGRPRHSFYCNWSNGNHWNGGHPVEDELLPTALFFLIENHRIENVRMISGNCELDVRGEPVTWIENIDAPSSLSMIEAVINGDRGGDRASKHAVDALAMHDNAADALIDVAKNHRDPRVRGSALFWLGQEAGAKAAGALRSAVDDDPEQSVREKAVFGIANLPDDRSIPMLAELMQTHRSAGVRKKAAFWLAQKKDPRALAAIESFLKK